MAVTVAGAQVGDRPYYIEGANKRTVTDLTLTGTYVTGGVAVTASDVDLNYVDHATAEINVNANASDSVATVGVAETSTGFSLLFYEESPAQITNGDTVTGMIVRVTAWGY